MFKLPVRTWILNAAAVLSGQHGGVTRQAEQSECSRETVYQPARKVESRLAAEPGAEAVTELREENQRLREEIAALRRGTEGLVRCDKATQRRLATTAFAMGVSLRQVEDLLGVLLSAAQVPDHSTLGHWVQAEARRHCSNDTGSRCPGLMQCSGCLGTALGLSLSNQVQRQPGLDRPSGPHPVHRLLHLPVTPIPPLHRVRRRPQQLLVQEHQRLLQARREQLLQRLSQWPEPPQSGPQLGQLGQRRRRPAPPIEQPVDPPPSVHAGCGVAAESE